MNFSITRAPTKFTSQLKNDKQKIDNSTKTIPFTISQNANYINQAIELSKQGAAIKGGAPIGAIVVSKDNEVIGRGYSQVGLTHDPTAHAEVVAIRDAASKLKSPDLKGASLYTTVAPCPLCLATSYWANIGKIYYSISTPEATKMGFPDGYMFNEFTKKPSERTIPMQQINYQKRKVQNWLEKCLSETKYQKAFLNLQNQTSIKKLYNKDAAEKSLHIKAI